MDVNYFNLLERYHDYRGAIHDLLESIITGIGSEELLGNDEKLNKVLCDISGHYPFVDILFTLDKDGIQSSENFYCKNKKQIFSKDKKGKNRKHRPYYRLASQSNDAVMTEPYLSNSSKKICISTSIKIINDENDAVGYIVLDIDLAETIGFLMGDSTRKRFIPFFKYTYVTIVFGLFVVVLLLLFNAFQSAVDIFNFELDTAENVLKPFKIIVYLTLALAVFDLGKTILEEEVLMHKDIFRHSSTRRTITRFVSAILIALLIEALLVIFKATVGYHDDYISGVWMMLAAIGLLVGLGLYVYLGARAEQILLNARWEQNRIFESVHTKSKKPVSKNLILKNPK